MNDPVAVALAVAQILDACGLRYLVGGSLFVMGGTPLDEEPMYRRLRVQVTADPDRYLYADTPEDILLQKLRWFRKGNEVSDRQPERAAVISAAGRSTRVR